MSAVTAELVPERDVTYGRSPLSHFVTDLWVLVKRSIARIRREPETLADVTFQPVIFILMFAYVFGGAIALLGGGNYHEYLIGGMHTNAADVIAAFALALLFGYAFTWAGICLGMTLRSPEAAQQTGFILFLPMVFISCAFVPIQGMPGWLQPVAEWNPMSAIATACRKLFGNPNPAAAIHSWPLQHPELAVLCWSAAMLVVFAPLAVHLYRRKALG